MSMLVSTGSRSVIRIVLRSSSIEYDRSQMRRAREHTTLKNSSRLQTRFDFDNARDRKGEKRTNVVVQKKMLESVASVVFVACALMSGMYHVFVRASLCCSCPCCIGGEQGVREILFGTALLSV
jgi:hypothetical protein